MSVAPSPATVICVVRCGGALYALPAVRVCEVLEWQAPVRVPLAPPQVSGVIVYQGDVLTVVCLSSLVEPASAYADAAMVVLEDPSTGERFVLSVESVEQVYAIAENEVHPPPQALSVRMQPLVTGLCRVCGDLVTLLNLVSLGPDRLLDELCSPGTA